MTGIPLCYSEVRVSGLQRLQVLAPSSAVSRMLTDSEAANRAATPEGVMLCVRALRWKVDPSRARGCVSCGSVGAAPAASWWYTEGWDRSAARKVSLVAASTSWMATRQACSSSVHLLYICFAQQRPKILLHVAVVRSRAEGS